MSFDADISSQCSVSDLYSNKLNSQDSFQAPEAPGHALIGLREAKNPLCASLNVQSHFMTTTTSASPSFEEDETETLPHDVPPLQPSDNNIVGAVTEQLSSCSSLQQCSPYRTCIGRKSPSSDTCQDRLSGIVYDEKNSGPRKLDLSCDMEKSLEGSPTDGSTKHTTTDNSVSDWIPQELSNTAPGHPALTSSPPKSGEPSSSVRPTKLEASLLDSSNILLQFSLTREDFFDLIKATFPELVDSPCKSRTNEASVCPWCLRSSSSSCVETQQPLRARFAHWIVILMAFLTALQNIWRSLWRIIL